MRGTNKPCPCCGETENKRRVDSVCYECKRLMNDGKKYRQELEKLDKQSDVVKVVIPASWCKPTYYTHHKVESVGEKIGDLLKEIASILIRNPDTMHYPSDEELVLFRKNKCDYFDHNVHGFMDKRVAEKLHALHFKIIAVIEQVENQSVEYGRDLLKQLAQGEISINEFNSFSK